MMVVTAAWLPVYAWISGASMAAAGSLVGAIWQGVLLTAGAALILQLVPRIPAGIRFAIWFGIFVLIAMLPIVGLWPSHGIEAHSPLSAHPSWFVVNQHWAIALASVWAIVSAVRAITLISAALRVRALWKRATPTPGISTIAGKRKAAVCISNEVNRPTVVGFFSPRILIPSYLMEKLTPTELEHVILHESSHLSRADDWLNLIQKIGLVLFPLNPALSWVERRLCFERELACDERVLGATGAPKTYAECLASLAGHQLQHRKLGASLALSLGILGQESELGRRVRKILNRRPTMKPIHARVLFGGVMILLFVSARGLEHCPQIVSFADPAANPQMGIASMAALPPGGYHAASLKMPANSAASQWKSIGDAEPVVSHRRYKPSHQGVSQQGWIAASPAGSANFTATELTTNNKSASSTEVMASGKRAQQQVMPVMIVTRWVAVTASSLDGAHVVQSMQEISTQPGISTAQQAARSTSFAVPYAAVPVQGGWLVFEL